MPTRRARWRAAGNDMATVWSTMRGAASHATLLLFARFFVNRRYIFSVLSVATFCYFCYYCRLSSALFRWEAASAGSGQSNARRSKRFWRCPRRALRFRHLWSPARSRSSGVRAGECSAHVADVQPRGVFYVLGRGAGPVMRRVWTLTCNFEIRRPRPRRNGAKLNGAWAPHRCSAP